MSPEVLEDARYSARADAYSAAVVLYEMLAGENPFLGKTLPATLNNVLDLQPFDLGARRADLPPELAEEIMACMAKRPQDRPPDVSRLLEAVRAARAQSQVAPPGPAPLLATHSIHGFPAVGRRRRRRRRAVTAAVAGVVSLAVVAWLLLPRPAPVEPPGPPPLPSVAASARPEPGLSLPPAAQSPNPFATPSARPQPRATRPPRPATPLFPASRPSSSAAPAATGTVAVARSPSPRSEGLATTLDAVSPRTVRRGLMVTLDLRGSGFRKGHQARVLRGRQAVASLRIVRQETVRTTLLRLTILVDEDVPLGTYAIVVVDAEGTPSNSVSFEVIL
jgi:serine/threonine-protein kinase